MGSIKSESVLLFQIMKKSNVTRAIYPGSFDPVTKGHTDLIRRATGIFDELIVAVADGVSKKTLFSLEERVHLIRQTTSDLNRVRVVGFKGLLIDFARERNSTIVIRGLRAVSDFEYEFQLAWTNKQWIEISKPYFLLRLKNMLLFLPHS